MAGVEIAGVEIAGVACVAAGVACVACVVVDAVEWTESEMEMKSLVDEGEA